ncbi:SGNH/GDSL hydrolase family protein [Ruminococcus flavefaciens]|uniref:Lysophospholipase L1 n=1 Tax=Ruminococcus flavefaciens TaxID=1265 RepID=A0A1M7HNN0_RUMFL|nr:SGNH/GDSL hydrolase family protein [Ruminococcus flavefaciens]SHM30105.1 Lysophospholipase L1 [Ruminococcus flavefaciens]
MKKHFNFNETKVILKRFMKIGTSLVLALSTLSLFPSTPKQAVFAADTIKIMPLGDSITYGMADEGGYRKYLSYFLQQNGYSNVDLVGPEGKDSASFNYNGQKVNYDDNHAGYSGYTITNLQGGWFGQLNGILETMQGGDYIKKYSPDIILLQIGTNDVSNGHLDGSEERLHTLLDYLKEKMPSDGKIFLTTIPDLGNTGWGGNSNGDIAKYNELIKKVANDYSSKNVIYADIHSVIDASKDLADGVHPNAGGYEKMGKYWFEKIESYLKSPDISQSSETTPPTPVNNDPEFIYGDLDGDKTITSLDLLIMRKGLIGDFKDNSVKKAADIDQNGKPEIADLVQLQSFILGKIKEFTVAEKPTTEKPFFEKTYNFPSVNQLKSSKDIPDPFIFMDGSKVESTDDWWKRQNEISCMYEYYMYGKWIDGSDDETTYSISGNSMTINVKRKSTGKTASFKAIINLPKNVRHEGGAPVILGMHKGVSESTATSNGYAVITYDSDGMFNAPGTAQDNNQHKGAFYDLYPYGRNWDEQTGDLMAWSWGISRILDALYAGAAKELNINPDSSIVTGVSRYGKAAAVCGAFETRIKMCAPSCSGAGGLALYRYSSVGKTYDFSSKGGSSSYTYKENEPLGSLQASGEQGWFNGRFMEFRDANQFPMDQHMLGSLCCDPNRYLFIIGSCESEDWVNAPSVWMAYLGMKHIWDYVGLSDHLAINIHKSGHAVIAEDVEKMIQYFDYHVYGIKSKINLDELQTSVFALPKNKDSFADTFASKWLY